MVFPLIVYIKGNSGRKKLSSNERAWQKTSHHHRPQCAKWFSRYSISKSGIWARWTSPFCRFSASFSFKYVTSQTQCCKIMKKSKCNISGVCCLICLKLCMLLELSKGISLDFKFRCYGNQNQNDCLLLKTLKVYCLSKNYVQTVI